MRKHILKKAAIITCLLLSASLAKAIGEPSTYFNIFVPPNAVNASRNVCLIVTAVYDSTAFSIVDDGMDGDTDDSKTGMLMAGQSYVLYIKDNGVNDDAQYASGGTLKQDGDYFIITSSKIVYASQATASDWQHDWVPATNKSGIGQKFIVYSPRVSSSNNDLNTFVYQDSTQITIRKISKSATNGSGYTNVDIFSEQIVAQKLLNRGQDLIYTNSNGRDLMTSGETYVIEANKPITVQYGALYGNERDGGGYVPSSTGNSGGELFYFAVPFQSGTNGEQEIRIVSLDAANIVRLERYNAGSWTAVKSWTLGANSPADWVGRTNSNVNYATVFRVSCTAGKRVSVFEANWLETGSPGTSDIGTMCGSLDGRSSGQDFLIYLAPPGDEKNVVNPFTGLAFGQQLTHAYLFSFNDTCHITVKDARTNGSDLSKTFTVMPGKYADCFLTLNEWRGIYNGTGTTAGGPERPYVLIHSDKPISVMNTNFNDNWMMYCGSALEQSFSQTTSSSKNSAKPGDTVTVSSQLIFNGNLNIDSAAVSITVGSGAKVTGSSLNNTSLNKTVQGVVSPSDNNTQIAFPLQDSLSPQYNYLITTTLVPKVMSNNGALLQNNAVISVETIVKGNVNGIMQQSASSEGISIQSSNTSNLMFNLSNLNNDLTNSWTANIIDLNGDGYEDIYVADKDANKPNLYYQNNGNKTFTKTGLGVLTNDQAITVCSAWADCDNDGDADVLMINNTQKPNYLYKNQSGTFSKALNSGLNSQPAYYHAGSFADYDNDGWLDIFVSNYMPTKFNELYRNKGDGSYEQVMTTPMSNEAFMSLGATWADYDNDGDQDLFVPNGNGANNSFFNNNGNGTFTKRSDLIICNDGGNSVGSCWGDINNDGWLDLYVANASNENDFLYVNNKNGGFNKITNSPVVTSGGHSHGCSFADVDNDADLDLYVTNDKGVKFLFMNDGNGNFTRNTDEVVTADYANSMGNYFFDADRDGDQDLFVATHSGQTNYFFTNNGNTNHWASYKLIGNLSNKGAIGARVSVKSAGKWQVREISCQSGIGGQSSIRAHFGLAGSTVIDSVRVNWPSGYVQTIANQSVNAFYTINEPSGAAIKGQVYYDLNNNCVKDAGENALGHMRVALGNGYYAMTNDQGYFKAAVPSGTYVLAAVAEGIWVAGCTIPSFSAAIMSTINANVPVTTTVSGSDINVSIGATAMRKGFKNQVVLHAENIGSNTAYNVPLKLTLGGFMKITESSPNYNSNAGPVYNWLIDTLKPGQSISIFLKDSVYRSSTVGATLTFTLNSNCSGDLNAANNNFVYTTEVVGAIDPNDLLVSPKGESDSGYVKAGTVLIYTIRFQNVGNYKASSISLHDQLPEGLDFEKVEFVSSSHPCIFNIGRGGRIGAQFENIELPDSTEDEPNSHGYLSFSAPLKYDLQQREMILNQAEITFDYEDPLQTNKVLNTLVNDLKSEIVMVYPNPCSSSLFVKLGSSLERYQGNNLIQSIIVYNLLGKIVKTTHPFASEAQLSFEEQPDGLYTLIIMDSSGNTFRSKVIVNK